MIISQVLKVGGRMVLVMTTGGEGMKDVYDQMRTEERWRDLLAGTRSVSVWVLFSNNIFKTL